MWDGEQPYIFLARRRTPEGARFDLAHELGHLVLHSAPQPCEGRIEEDEANQFAAHFLIDDLKCRGRLSFNGDQAAHIACKLAWVVIALQVIQ